MQLNHEEIGSRLKKVRQSLGLTQADMGSKLNIGSYYQRIERADDRASEHALLNLALNLDINYQWLLYGIGENPDMIKPKETDSGKDLNENTIVPETGTNPDIIFVQKQADYEISIGDFKAVKLVIYPCTAHCVIYGPDLNGEELRIVCKLKNLNTMETLLNSAFNKFKEVLK